MDHDIEMVYFLVKFLFLGDFFLLLNFFSEWMFYLFKEEGSDRIYN